MIRIPKPGRILALSRALARQPGLITARKDYIIILGHMRSYSTLLSHILGSHAEISGYAEMHTHYRNELSLLELKVKIALSLQQPLRGRYVLDKLLHNYLTIAPRYLRHPRVRILFLVRKPEATLQSIVRLYRSTAGDLRPNPVERALEYYVGRLQRLVEYAEICGSSAFFIPAERTVEDSDRLLSDLRDWLSLDSDLAPGYDVFQHTGKPGFGDPSEMILSGAIESKGSVKSFVPIHSEIMNSATSSYRRCHERLQGMCTGSAS